MTRSTYARGAMGTAIQKFDPQFETRAERQDREDRAVLNARAVAYRKVDVRDGAPCRACFIRTNPDGRRLVQPEHHHIHGRGGVKKETTANIAKVCKGCHDKIHVKRTMTMRGNADRTLYLQEGERQWISLPPNTVQKLTEATS